MTVSAKFCKPWRPFSMFIGTKNTARIMMSISFVKLSTKLWIRMFNYNVHGAVAPIQRSPTKSDLLLNSDHKSGFKEQLIFPSMSSDPWRFTISTILFTSHLEPAWQPQTCINGAPWKPFDRGWQSLI
jgi:hypothetical protein